MDIFNLKVHPEKNKLIKEDQLAWRLASIASKNTQSTSEAIEMVGNRIIDNASVALASLNRNPVKTARMQALAHSKPNGARLFGLPSNITVYPEWATWANNTAVRELDFHDTYLAADYSHPGDNIPAILAVAERKNIGGEKLVQAILTAYEVHVNLVKAICLHKHKIDHVAHLAPATAAGIGTLLGLDTETIYHAINQAEHVSISTRQSRKGQISSWKAFAPGHACKLAVEAVDRAMRGEHAPSPIWEGEDSVVAWVLDGKDAHYQIPLPQPGEPCNAILETYTKEHSAEYQAQALIDLAFDLSETIPNLDDIQEIILHTSHHTHYVIGTGANDPQKMDPNATRETLDHSIMYIFAVALEDRAWHHVKSYTQERAHKESTIKLWNKIKTQEDSEWTKRYHDPDPNNKAFGARVEVTLKDGRKIVEERGLANAHPAGEKPFGRDRYKNKFETLTGEIITSKTKERFYELIENLPRLTPQEIKELIPEAKEGYVVGMQPDDQGIF